MNKILTCIILLTFSISYAQHRVIDTLVDVGGYNMHFNLIKGTGTPILFESGAGNDGKVWEEIAQHVYDITGTTVIYYDRSGFGKSELNPKNKIEEEFGIVNGLLELETSLKKLKYFNNLILVSHSYGGFYTTLFSARNPSKVLYNIRVDANLAQQYTEDILVKTEQDNFVHEMKNENLGMYYMGINFANTVRLMWKTEYPRSIPAIDIISPIQRHHTDDEWNLLIKTHEDFVKEAPNRIGIVAYGSGHYIYKDNPGLVINAIVKAYVYTLCDDSTKLKILNKSVDKSIELFIEGKQNKKE
ncbi:alpha/beta fold hydrolase [Hyphobacterium sp. CCMP332]|nr:alpha/beta fold hydrolase [Hyphobacterium sp. CCMP332]